MPRIFHSFEINSTYRINNYTINKSKHKFKWSQALLKETLMYFLNQQQTGSVYFENY